MTRRIACLLLLLVVIVPTVLLRREVHSQPGKVIVRGGTNQLQGTVSCAASPCHGGNDPGKPRSEYTTWVTLDPHARGYTALQSDTAKRIMAKLGSATPAHREGRCLACHVTGPLDRARPNFRKEDGVGCESCHGPAEKWIAVHYRPGWRDADQRGLGFADTKSLHGRAQLCVGCHIGSASAHVDHDLLAAGHPPLRFEFAAYLANLPPHWDVKKDRQQRSSALDHIDFDARAWRTGQLVSAAAALELRAHRVGTHEFADMDCFSCHHDLQGTSWRRERKHLQNRRPGSFVGNDWYFAMVPTIADVDLSDQPDQVALTLRRLARQAEKAAPTDGIVTRLIKGLPEDRSWDQAAQRYLAMLAFRQARLDLKEDVELTRRLDEEIKQLRTEIAFRGWQSPKGYRPPAK